MVCWCPVCSLMTLRSYMNMYVCLYIFINPHCFDSHSYLLQTRSFQSWTLTLPHKDTSSEHSRRVNSCIDDSQSAAITCLYLWSLLIQLNTSYLFIYLRCSVLLALKHVLVVTDVKESRQCRWPFWSPRDVLSRRTSLLPHERWRRTFRWQFVFCFILQFQFAQFTPMSQKKDVDIRKSGTRKLV